MITIGEEKEYNTEDSGLKRRNGQLVEVLKQIAENELGFPNFGSMYEIRFPDGYVRRAFEAELV